MENLRKTLAAALLCACAASPTASLAAGASPTTVVELFTSQGCYSCPPAEAYLGELVARGDVIALEFHVDYWDSLVYGAAGRWKDVFSDPRFSERQRSYASTFGSGRVYTPQMVIGGRSETVGSNRASVSVAIDTVHSSPRQPLRVAVSQAPTGGLAIDLDGKHEESLPVWLVIYDERHVTEVLAGENKGKSLANHHVVRDLRQVGEWQGAATQLVVDEPGLGDGQGCAVLVQPAALGPILGAAACPAPGS